VTRARYEILLLVPGSPAMTLGADRVSFDPAALDGLVANLSQGESCLYLNPGPALAVAVSHLSDEALEPEGAD
jgi:hypothetical protein